MVYSQGGSFIFHQESLTQLPKMQKLSTERRSISRRSIRSGQSSQNLDRKGSSSFSESNAQLIVRSVMQDILSNALKEIHERYMEKQMIKFVVHCAHQALTKALRIHFYRHNDYIRTASYWGPDRRVEPSSPDSWAIDQVPLTKNISAEQEISTLSQINLEMASHPAEASIRTGADIVSEPSETLTEDVRNVIDEMIDGLPIVDEEKAEEKESVVSAFTMVVEGSQHYKDFKMKPQLSRISLDDITFKLPKIDLPDSGNSRTYQSVTDLSNAEITKLPPIRTDANYKSRPPAPTSQDDKTKKNKK